MQEERSTTPRLFIAPITHRDIPELERCLRNEDVYRLIGGIPSSEHFHLSSERAIAGPSDSRCTEVWLNFAVRLRRNNELVGRLEATIHDGIAEVAFLFARDVWGNGYATEGLLWLHAQLESRAEPPALWAATVPENVGSRALLSRCGYIQVLPERLPNLLTYDDGDVVFMLPRAT
jgi:RimJ/RimL family protein N-acetyltransferase